MTHVSQALLYIRVVTEILKDPASMHTNQYKEQAQFWVRWLTPFASGNIWNTQIVSYFVWQMISNPICCIFKSACVWERNRKKKNNEAYKDTRTLSIKEAIKDKYQVTIQNDLWGEAHNTSVQKNFLPFIFIISTFSSLSISRHSLYSFFIYNTIILFLSSSHTHVHSPLPLSLWPIHGSMCLLTINRY